MEPRRPPRRRSRPPDQRGQARARSRQSKRYRYGALLGIMLFAGIGGICLGFSGLGGHTVTMGLVIAGIPALLLSIGCAAAFVYF
jgi:hypothetical protein